MRTVLPVKRMGRFVKGASATADASRLNAEANAALCLVQWLEAKIVSKEEMIEIDNIESHEELPGGSDKPEYGSYLI